MRGRVVVVAVALAGTVAAVAVLAARDGWSTRTSQDDAVVGRAPTTTARTPATVPPPSSTPATAAEPAASGSGFAGGAATAPVEEPPGLVVTNAGSATADVGGNVVAGGDPASVVSGSATAIGNVSSVRAP